MSGRLAGRPGSIVAVSAAMAFLLYLDRICMAEIVTSASFHSEVRLSKREIGAVLSAFFFAYALCQVPSGWASDRFGPRRMLTAYILVWSLATALTGMVAGFGALLGMRLLCGMGEAGAYPASGAIVREWVPLVWRARASSVIVVGGRLGGALAPFITAALVVGLGRWRPALWIDGAAGLAVAAGYWTVVRDAPHAARKGPPPSWRTLLRRRSVRRVAVMLFLMNFGSVFLITWLATYLKEEQRVADLAGGRMVTVVLAVGAAAALAGGWFGDRCVCRLGLRRGRSLALFAPGVFGACGYLGCLIVHEPWLIVACCAVVAIGVDMAQPGTWALLQDLGGDSPATVFGWGNMWGNLGAALVSAAVPWMTVSTPGLDSHRYVFLACAAALALGGALAWSVDAENPI